MATTKKYYVYVLLCADNTLYTGFSDDVERRLETHNAGKGAKYTKARLPVSLIYSEEFPDKSSALKKEYAFKKLTRKQKIAFLTTKDVAL